MPLPKILNQIKILLSFGGLKTVTPI
jgi:hypothetical protein